MTLCAADGRLLGRPLTTSPVLRQRRGLQDVVPLRISHRVGSSACVRLRPGRPPGHRHDLGRGR
jgi:hypothetical protein